MTLITEEYRKLLQHEHQTTEWGHTAEQYTSQIMHFAEKLNETAMLDYGAGRGGLKMHLPDSYSVIEYEPGREDAQHNNTPHNYVVCIDVLEHIEPELIDNVLDDLQRVTVKGGYYTVSTRHAGRALADGRNAHLIVEPFEWWTEKLTQRFDIEWSEYDDSRQRGEYFVRRKNESKIN